MFHGIGQADHPYEPGEQDYWVSQQGFVAALDACARFDPTQYVLTFDDGNASDLDAARLMAARGMTGIFFVLVGRIGQTGYLSRDGIGEMIALGMKIGLHGRDHVDWRRTDDATLRREVDASGEELADLCKAPVTSLAIPYGAYDRRVWSYLTASRYDQIHTSDRGLWNGRDRYVRRNPIMAWHGTEDIAGLISDDVPLLTRMRRTVVTQVKRLI